MSHNLEQVVEYLDRILDNSSYQDEFLNGLQVDSGNRQVLKVAAAVDSGLSVIEKAIAQKADLLIVHHGIVDQRSKRITDIYGKKIQLLINNGCSLYGSHLPLDGNMQVGNAIELARLLSLENIEPYFEIDKKTLGVKATCKSSAKIEDFLPELNKLDGAIKPLILDFGPKEIKTVGIVTGSGSSAIQACAEAGIDLLISGEAKQAAYHNAKEQRVNTIFAGHYATETVGVKALLRCIAKDLQISTVFIDEPTGI